MTLDTVLDHHLDIALFVAVIVGLSLAADRLTPERARRFPYPALYMPFLGLLVAGGIAAALYAGTNERVRMRDMLQGMAPTYASEMLSMGLMHIGLNTPPDDPDYLRIIAAQKRWLSANPVISDIYTLTRTPDGRVLIVVDSETDYNGDGDFDDPREQRSAIGTVYEDHSGEIGRAFQSGGRFTGVPYTDDWGTWVSAYVMLQDAAHGLPVMVGADYRAASWQTAIARQRGLMLALFTLLATACIAAGMSMRVSRADVLAERENQETLRRAREQADQANRAKSAFLASMSHEIRTPMNGVLGMLQLLRTTPLSEEQREHIETAFRSGQSLLGILNDILDFSKIEADMLELELVPCDIRALLNDVVALHATNARNKQLQIAGHVRVDVPRVLRCDSIRVRQVLNNLLSNAIKFTAEGSVRIEVGALPPATPDAPMRLRFTVSDTGIGIPAGKQALVFDSFTQADQTITRRYGGTGLGLAICRRLVEAMGGTIDLDSIEGKGTTFRFELPVEETSEAPLATEAPPAIAPEPEPAAAPPPPAATATSTTAPADTVAADCEVLVVEDNLVNQKVTMGMLKRLGYSARIAGDGRQGLDAMRNGTYRLVLMDMQMPVMDGLEATRQWRAAEPAGRHLPIVAMTANAQTSDREACLEAGMDAFLSKPVQLTDLRAMLQRYVGPGTAS